MCMISNLISIFATLHLNIIKHASHAYVLQMISFYFVLFFLNTQTWLLYFNKKWTYFVMQLKWQQLINPSVLQKGHKNNWYIMTRYKYGNIWYISKTFGIIHFITIIITTIIIYCTIDTKSWQLQIFGVISLFEIFFIFIAFFVIIIKKTPHSLEDVFHIQWESKCLCKIWIIGFIFALIIAIIAAYFGQHQDEYRAKLWSVLLLHELLIMITASSIISTVILISKNTQNHSKKHSIRDLSGNSSNTISDRLQIGITTLMSNNSSASNHSNNSNQTFNKKCIKLEQVLTNKKGVNLFMRYLARELRYNKSISYKPSTYFFEITLLFAGV